MEESFYQTISNILQHARNSVYRTANTEMVNAYWNIGKAIVHEQGGTDKAEYGQKLIGELSARMTSEFGKGFTVTNLRDMRQFYLTFQNKETLHSELTWSHYRMIMRVENPAARQFYLEETVKSQWSTRQLKRQISTFFYERLLSSKNKAVVAGEIRNWSLRRIKGYYPRSLCS